MRKLFAFYENKKVGVLTKDEEDVYSFEYEKSWREDPISFPISFSMPLQEEKFGNKVSLSFFENLLPEGEVRRELEGSHKIKGVFDFLAEFGLDCAGAIQLTENESLKARKLPQELVPIEMGKIDKAIKDNLSVAQVISKMNPGYLSLAGAQDKFPAVLKGGKFYLPKNGYPTTHIVKTPIWRHGVKESVYNEYFCMELARTVGLQVPDCQVVMGIHPLFVVERYDRRIQSGETFRIHQQDLCQAQGFSSENKYESRGGPSLAKNYEFIKENTGAQYRMQSLEGFLNWVCFNLIVGNNDSHSKNVSLLLSKNATYRLAPCYDLMCTAIYARLEQSFSFKIGGRNEFSKIGKNQLKELENQSDLKEGMFREKLQKMSLKLSASCGPLAEKLKASIPEAKITYRICELLEKRIKSLKLQRAI